jgi:hypothetical protein
MVLNTDIGELGVLEAGKSAFRRLETSAPNHLAAPGCEWLPGGNDILYTETLGNTRVMVQQSVAGGPVRQWGPIGLGGYLRGIGPDGKQVLLSEHSHLKLFQLPLQGGLASAEFSVGDDFYGSLSPDGKWVAYVSASQREVFARPLAGPAAPRQISNSRGAPPIHPTWRGDGKEILYLAGDQIWSVTVDLARGQFAAPVPLFKARIPPATTVSRMLAVTRDGSRILAPVTTEQTGAAVFHVVTDWTAALKPR